MPCFLHKQPELAGAILFLFPIFTSLLALFSSSGSDRPPPSRLHPASWPRPGASEKMSVCDSVWGWGGDGTRQLGLHSLGHGELTPSPDSSVVAPSHLWDQPWRGVCDGSGCVFVPDSVSSHPSMVLRGLLRLGVAWQRREGDWCRCVCQVGWAVALRVDKCVVFLPWTWLDRVC